MCYTSGDVAAVTEQNSQTYYLINYGTRRASVGVPQIHKYYKTVLRLIARNNYKLFVILFRDYSRVGDVMTIGYRSG